MAEARARKGRATYEEGQQALAEVEYLPAMPSVAAKTPELKPEGGGFKANILSPTRSTGSRTAGSPSRRR
jgi:hypothetical protein